MNARLGAETSASPSKGARTRGNDSAPRDEDRNVFAPENSFFGGFFCKIFGYVP